MSATARRKRWQENCAIRAGFAFKPHSSSPTQQMMKQVVNLCEKLFKQQLVQEKAELWGGCCVLMIKAAVDCRVT